MAGLPLSNTAYVVDLMSGMGELWKSLGKHLPDSARVVGVDLSPEMVRRAHRQWPFSTDVVIADALEWDCPPDCADVVVSSFGLKTFDREQQGVLAQRVARMLKPGGSFSFLEISVPPSATFRVLYMFYVRQVIPVVGRILLGDPACYRMLGVYTEAFGNAAHFSKCLREQGLEAVLVSHFFGCATSVRGRKPESC